MTAPEGGLLGAELNEATARDQACLALGRQMLGVLQESGRSVYGKNDSHPASLSVILPFDTDPISGEDWTFALNIDTSVLASREPQKKMK